MTELENESKVFKTGICRCCMNVGLYKDITAAYNWMGDTEIYINMLKSCFNIDVSYNYFVYIIREDKV